MKVCLVTGEYPPMPGGVGDYTCQLGRALRKLDVSVSVLAPRKVAAAPQRPEEPALLPWVDRWNYTVWKTVRRAIAESECDVLHIQYQTGAYAMHPAINLLPLRFRPISARPRIVTTFHDLRVPYLFPKAGRLRFLANHMLLRYSDAAVLTNVEDFLSAARRQIDRQGVTPGRLAKVGHFHLVPIGSNIDVDPPDDFDRARWRQKLGVLPQETLLSYFGLLNSSKGFDSLLKALRQILDRQLPVKLIVVGGDVGQSDQTNLLYRDQIRDLIAALGLDPYLIWTGHSVTRDVSAHLVASDICVLPFRDGASFRRGSLMAALVHGLPLISTYPPSDDHAEWEARLGQPAIVDRKQALLVPPDDSKAIAEAVLALVSSPALRQKLGTGARSLADHFTWPSIARYNLEIYREICS